MALIKYKEWESQMRESSAFTRWRREAALGQKPPIAPASIHSRSTASPFEAEKLGGKKKKSRKKKD